VKCPECGSEKLEYLPNVDGASWVNVKYKRVNGKWKIVATDDEGKDVSTISTKEIYYNDGMSFFCCKDCTAEIDGRYV
jgi:adenine-specific DNA methylase